MARATLIVALLLAGCAHAPPATTATPVQPLPPPEAEAGRGPSGGDIEKILKESGLSYTVLEPDKRWMIAFAGKRLPRLVVFVVHGDDFTLVMGRLFTARDDAGADFYRKLARRNFDHDQIKLSVDPEGGVYASYEVPTRLLDRQELLDDVYGLAGAMDLLIPDLAEDARPVELDEEPAPEEPRLQPAPLPRRPPPPILEVRRSGSLAG